MSNYHQSVKLKMIFAELKIFLSVMWMIIPSTNKSPAISSLNVMGSFSACKFLITGGIKNLPSSHVRLGSVRSNGFSFNNDYSSDKV